MKVVTNNGGLNYTITEANLVKDTWYSVNISKSGYEFKVPNIYVPIPYEPIPVEMSVLLTGFFGKIIITLNYNVPNISISDLKITPSITVMSITSNDMGLTYILEADFYPNTVYTLNIEKYGYNFRALKFLSQKEFIHNYSMADVVSKFGLDPNRYIAEIKKYRLLGNLSNRERLMFVPIIDIQANAKTGNLYGMVFCRSSNKGINDWHFLNTPVNLIGGIYENRDLSYMTISRSGSNIKAYFMGMIREDLLDSSEKTKGYLYTFDWNTYVDGQTIKWQEIISEDLWEYGNEYDSVNDHEYFLGCGPLVMLDATTRCRIMGYKYQPYYSDYSLLSIWNRDMISVNPTNNTQIWWQTDLSKSQSNSYACSWYFLTGEEMSLTNAGSGSNAWARVKIDETGNPIWYFTMLYGSVPRLYKPEDIDAGLSSGSYKIMPINGNKELAVLDNDYNNLDFSAFYAPPIAFKVGLSFTKISQYNIHYIQLVDGDIVTRGFILLCPCINKSELGQYNLTNPIMYFTTDTRGDKWYPREIIRNKDSWNNEFIAIMNFSTVMGGIMLFEGNSPSYDVYYLPTDDDEAHFFVSTQFMELGKRTENG